MRIEKSSRVFFKIVGAVLLACLLFIPVSGRAEQKEAETTVKKLNATLLESMKNGKELGFQGRYKLLDPVLRDVLAIRYMGEKCLGEYWKGLNPEQKQQYMDLYTDWTISAYAGNFDGYAGEIFETYEGKPLSANMAYVPSKLVKPKEEGNEFDYTLRRFQDKWRVVDIKVEGISQLTLTRDQFVTVMKNQGFDALLGILKDKVATLHGAVKQE